MPRNPLSVFDDDTFASVAAEFDIDVAELRAIASTHQEGVRDLPGVDDIVYEWRNQFHQDPLLYRTEAVYVLALQPHVWDEFGDTLDIDDDELAALMALHDRQARALTEEGTRLSSDSALVLTRP